ncbi:MAG TPA: glutamate mutase L, partial [Jiangellaceae bacterium]|nr:glutamate mutase L [Jiangellaceae bacterium]
MSAVICVDFGSTFTKAALVDLAEGRIVAAAAHRTTIDTDVLDGYDACRAVLVAQDVRAADADVLACSSAGGGLRIAVVGNEELVTAEAGRRVALSSGGKVVCVVGVANRTPEEGPWLPEVRDALPDVVLLTGGTDGGNAEVLLSAARGLADAGWTGPVVVAGNVDA